MAKNIMKNILWFIARKMAHLGFIYPFVFLYSKLIKEIGPQKGKLTLLALTPSRFRGDLEILANKFRILAIPSKWQSRIVTLFYTKPMEFRKYYHPHGDESVMKMQDELRSFLKVFLFLLYNRLNVDGVIGAACHYTQDYDWGVVSEEIGVPYIVLHRENLAASPNMIGYYCNRSKRMDKFRGSYIIVHNDAMKHIFIRSGYVSPDEISTLGCLRMDSFIKRIKDLNVSGNRRRKKVTLFSFRHGTALSNIMPAWSKDGNRGFVKLFEHVHTAIARLAMRNPDIDFVIKPKWGGDWPDRVIHVCQKNGIEIKNIDNISIVLDADVHNLILSSDVICSFGSTTLLEAAIASKPVIVPYFDEALKPEYANAVLFKNEFHLFDIAYSVSEFEDLILKRLHNPGVSEECMSQRFRIFEKYVSSMKGDALDKYSKVIKQIIYDRFPDLKRKEKSGRHKTLNKILLEEKKDYATELQNMRG